MVHVGWVLGIKEGLGAERSIFVGERRGHLGRLLLDLFVRGDERRASVLASDVTIGSCSLLLCLWLLVSGFSRLDFLIHS